MRLPGALLCARRIDELARKREGVTLRPLRRGLVLAAIVVLGAVCTSAPESATTTAPATTTTTAATTAVPTATTTVIVPMHRGLARGTLRSILRQADLTVEAFTELL